MIQVKKLQFTYPGASVPTLHGLDFSVQDGEVFGFLGPSGAGKSTTQKILIGSLRSYKGEARVLGKDIREAGPEYYERIGVAFEFPNFYQKFTVLENLKLFQSLYAGKTEEPKRLLARVGLEDVAQRKVCSFLKG